MKHTRSPELVLKAAAYRIAREAGHLGVKGVDVAGVARARQHIAFGGAVGVDVLDADLVFGGIDQVIAQLDHQLGVDEKLQPGWREDDDQIREVVADDGHGDFYRRVEGVFGYGKAGLYIVLGAFAARIIEIVGIRRQLILQDVKSLIYN